MKAIIVFFALFAVAAAVDPEYYETVDDNLDIDEDLSEIATLKRYVDCFVGIGPCSERTASYKAIIHKALISNCEKCNDLQKHLANGFLKGLKAALPEEYRNFRLLYDPEDQYFDNFEKAVEAY